MRQLLYYKLRQKFITNCITFLLKKCDSLITKYDSYYYNMCRFYYKMRQLLQNVTFITKCVDTVSNKAPHKSASTSLIFYYQGQVRSSHGRCSVKKDVLKYFGKFTGKHLCQSPFFNKAVGHRLPTLLKKRLKHRCFPVNFVKFLRAPFYRTPPGECFSQVSVFITNLGWFFQKDCGLDYWKVAFLHK